MGRRRAGAARRGAVRNATGPGRSPSTLGASPPTPGLLPLAAYPLNVIAGKLLGKTGKPPSAKSRQMLAPGARTHPSASRIWPWTRIAGWEGRSMADEARESDGQGYCCPACLIAFCLMRRRFALSASVSEAETGQSLLMMKSTSAGASAPAAARLLFKGDAMPPRTKTASSPPEQTNVFKVVARALA